VAWPSPSVGGPRWVSSPNPTSLPRSIPRLWRETGRAWRNWRFGSAVARASAARGECHQVSGGGRNRHGNAHAFGARRYRCPFERIRVVDERWGASTATPGAAGLCPVVQVLLGPSPGSGRGSSCPATPAACAWPASRRLQAGRRAGGGGPASPATASSKLCPPGWTRLTPSRGQHAGEAALTKLAGSFPCCSPHRAQGRTGSPQAAEQGAGSARGCARRVPPPQVHGGRGAAPDGAC